MPCIDFLRSADRLCVISQSVKDDLCSYLGFDGGTIDVKSQLGEGSVFRVCFPVFDTEEEVE